MQVYISWSGEHSRRIAQTLNDWIPAVIQGTTCWILTEDIKKGRDWWTQIKEHLHNSSYGLICVTPNSINSPWFNFEVGTLLANSKSPPISTFILGIKPRDIQGPLRIFQGTRYDDDDIWRLVKNINSRRGEDKTAEDHLKNAFQYSLPSLREKLDPILREMSKENANFTKEAAKKTQTARKLNVFMKEKVDILVLLGNSLSPNYLSDIARALEMNEQQALFYLEELTVKGFLEIIHNYVLGPQFHLTQESRRFLVTNGHVKSQSSALKVDMTKQITNLNSKLSG